MRKLTLVLPGGGACGRWQAGVIQYLSDAGVLPQINLICGTSVGGLNTIAVGKYLHSMEGFKAMWASIKSNKDIFDGMLQFKTFWDVIGMVGQIFNTNKGKSILTPKGLYTLLDKEFGNVTIGDLAVPVMITSTELTHGERYMFSSIDHPEIKSNFVGKCTSAIPLAFPAVEQEKYLFSDGGLGRNNPIDVAITEGSTHIILIGTTPDTYPVKEMKNTIVEVALRMEDIIMHIFEEESWEAKTDYAEKQKLDPTLPIIKFLDIYPSESTGDALNFGNVEQFQKGYDFAVANLPEKVLTEFLK